MFRVLLIYNQNKKLKLLLIITQAIEINKEYKFKKT